MPHARWWEGTVEYLRFGPPEMSVSLCDSIETILDKLWTMMPRCCPRLYGIIVLTQSKGAENKCVTTLRTSCWELYHHILQLSTSCVQEVIRQKSKSISQITIDTKNVPKSTVAFRWSFKLSSDSSPWWKAKGLSSYFSENYLSRNINL